MWMVFVCCCLWKVFCEIKHDNYYVWLTQYVCLLPSILWVDFLGVFFSKFSPTCGLRRPAGGSGRSDYCERSDGIPRNSLRQKFVPRRGRITSSLSESLCPNWRHYFAFGIVFSFWNCDHASRPLVGPRNLLPSWSSNCLLKRCRHVLPTLFSLGDLGRTKFLLQNPRQVSEFRNGTARDSGHMGEIRSNYRRNFQDSWKTSGTPKLHSHTLAYFCLPNSGRGEVDPQGKPRQTLNSFVPIGVFFHLSES